MKRFPKILAAACAAVALSSSLALAAEPQQAPAQVPTHFAGHGAHGALGPMSGPMMGPLAQLSPEKQEAARKLMAEHAKAIFPMHQDLYARYAALEAINAAGEGDSAKAKAAIRDIADLNAKMLAENSAFRARMFKETGLRVPVMGHGMMFGAGMMGGKGGCGEMMGSMGSMGHAGAMGGHAGAMDGHAGAMEGVPAPAHN